MWWNGGLERDDHGGGASAIPTHGTSANPGGQPRRLDTQLRGRGPSSMCARVQSDVLRVLRVLRGPVFQFRTCLSREVFGVLRDLCVLLGLYVLYALCALYAFSKPYVQHRGPQKRASGQKRTDGCQRNIYGPSYRETPP